MRFVLIFSIILFTFLGMFIGKKYDLKYFSINSIFGLFLVNGIFNLFVASNYLSINYHYSTWIYLFLCIILGFVLSKLVCIKSDNPDDVSIACFSFFNCFLLFLGNFNLFSFLISILYYILIGIYIKDTKSYINVFLGFVFSFIASFISSWMIGYLLSCFIGIVLYFIFSIYGVVGRNSEKSGLVGLILGIVIGVIGGVL